MSKYATETVLDVRHWNDTLFSFRTTRDPGLRFDQRPVRDDRAAAVEGKPLTRAYSIASANHDEFLEFFSIKVPDGPLTSTPATPENRRRSSSAASRPARWSCAT
jgi:ferredoxin--NADP+ reductase